jgi:phage-related protein (TIGR01555 family)
MWPFKKKQPKTDATPKGDGMMNVITGMGVSGYDKRMGAEYATCVVPDLVAREIWRASDIAARVIESMPDEALRPGFEVQIQDDEDGEQGREVDAKLEELGLADKVRTAWHYQRAYGGAAIFPVMNDGQDLAAPLNEERIPEVRQLHVFEPAELTPASHYTDPREEKFGETKLWRLQPIAGGAGAQPGIEIHESRLVILQGIRVTKAETATLRQGWGDSVLSRLMPVLRDFDSVFHGAGVLVQDFAQAVYRLQGLAQLMAAGNEKAVVDRMRLMDVSRSVLRAIVMDKEDEFHREPTPLGGLPELMDRMMQRLSAAADMPATKLMGMSPAGMNATGESDRVSWHNTCDAGRERTARPALERIVQLVLLSKSGPTKGKEPENWSLRFLPLWQPSEKEIVETRKIQADTDAIYLSQGVLFAEEVAQSRFGGPEYSVETSVDFAARKKLEEQAEREETEAAAAAREQEEGEPAPDKGEDIEEEEEAA